MGSDPFWILFKVNLERMPYTVFVYLWWMKSEPDMVMYAQALQHVGEEARGSGRKASLGYVVKIASEAIFSTPPFPMKKASLSSLRKQ